MGGNIRLDKTFVKFAVMVFLFELVLSVNILYLQETKLDATSTSTTPPQTTTIATFCSTCSNKTQYGISAWVYKVGWIQNQWNCPFRVANDLSFDSYEARIILACAVLLASETDCLIFMAATSDEYGVWCVWKNSNDSSVFFLNQWVFVSAFVDQTTNTQYGVRYYLDQVSNSNNVIFQTKNDDLLYQLSPSAVVTWGGSDKFFGPSVCWLQYVRVYLDWVADSADKMINLALMEHEGNLYRFYFTSDPLINKNQTFIVDNTTNTIETNVIGFKGYSLLKSTQVPFFGAYNTLMCRPGQIASFPLNYSISKSGLVVAMDFFPYSNGSSVQTIFSIRDSATNFVSLRCDYFLPSGTLDIWINPLAGNPYYVFNSTITSNISINADNWNRVILEILQAQPQSFGIGFSSARVWVNQTATPRVFFGNFSTGDTTIADGNNAAFEICGVFDSTSPNLVSSSLGGYFDALNFVWFQGAQGLFQNTTNSSCILQGLIQGNQMGCLQCANGYFLQDSITCVTGASNSSYFLHTPTNSYQRCFYGQYYNISSGACVPCTQDGQLVASPQCKNCDPSCRKCSGTYSTQCTACYPDAYLLANSTGAYCLVVCSTGYEPDHASNQCVTSLVNISKAQSATLVAAPLITSIALTVSSIASGGFSINMMLCLVATESLANMQYLNLNHSNIALTVYAGMSSSYVPNWIVSFNNLDNSLLIFNWGIFQKNQISGLYFDNFGDSLTEILIYFGLFLLTCLLAFSPKIERLTYSYVGKAYLTAFNFLIANVLGIVQSQILFSILQIIKINLLFDTYCWMSLFTGIATMSLLIEMLIFFFLKLRILFENQGYLRRRRVTSEESSIKRIQIVWLQKKYELLVGDFKNSTKKQFFFAYWITAFNSYPVLQCLSIVSLVIAFMVFSAKIKPFKRRASTFLHFFNFTSVLIAAILNLSLAFSAAANPESSNDETIGWAIVSVILMNTGTNTLFSLGVMIFAIYKNMKLCKKTTELQESTPEIQFTTNNTSSLQVQSRINNFVEPSGSQNNERSLDLPTIVSRDNDISQLNLVDSNGMSTSKHQPGTRIRVQTENSSNILSETFS